MTTNDPKKPLAVYAITPERRDRDGKLIKKEGDGFWHEVGAAFINADQSINVYLDAVPVTGRLNIRERKERSEATTAAGGVQ